jgi:hypothetical protein
LAAFVCSFVFGERRRVDVHEVTPRVFFDGSAVSPQGIEAMGFFNSIKKAVSGPTPAQQAAAQPSTPQAAAAAAEHNHRSLDLAGFEPDRDEEGFFNAVLHMESAGEHGGTDASRAEIMARYGIRDRSHWLKVKESVYHMLAHKHGSMDQVVQNEMNWRSGETQRRMQQAVKAKAASGEMTPVEGITLEAWAAFNAAIVGGANLDDLLKGAGIERARWDAASAEWNARMSRDLTFAIATTYGNAFQAASKGKYAELVKEANAARAANRDLALPPPMSMEDYYTIMFEQSYAVARGKDAAQALGSMGLTIVDFTDLSGYMGYYFHRTGVLKHQEYADAMKRAEDKVKARYPG